MVRRTDPDPYTFGSDENVCVSGTFPRTVLCQSLVDAFVDALNALGWFGAATLSANDGSC
jgi:hypothetical protein